MDAGHLDLPAVGSAGGVRGRTVPATDRAPQPIPARPAEPASTQGEGSAGRALLLELRSVDLARLKRRRAAVRSPNSPLPLAGGGPAGRGGSEGLGVSDSPLCARPTPARPAEPAPPSGRGERGYSVGFADTNPRAQGSNRTRRWGKWSWLEPEEQPAVVSQPRSARHCLRSCAFGGLAWERKAPRALTDCLFGSVPGRMPRESPHLPTRQPLV
jgi:hypothetical protein